MTQYAYVHICIYVCNIYIYIYTRVYIYITALLHELSSLLLPSIPQWQRRPGSTGLPAARRTQPAAPAALDCAADAEHGGATWLVQLPNTTCRVGVGTTSYYLWLCKMCWNATIGMYSFGPEMSRSNRIFVIAWHAENKKQIWQAWGLGHPSLSLQSHWFHDIWWIVDIRQP